MDCPHVIQCNLRIPTRFETFSCKECKAEDSPWLCLDCGQINCGRYIKGHAKAHFEEMKHCISVDCYSLGAYCYACDSFITNQHLIPKRIFDKLNEHHHLHHENLNLSDGESGESADIHLAIAVGSKAKSRPLLDSATRRNRRARRLTHRKKRRKKPMTPKEPPVLPISEEETRRTTRKRSHESLLSTNDLNKSPCDDAVSGKKPKLQISRSLENGIPTRRTNRTKENLLDINKALKHGVVGLRNLGNTCFMNAVLQSLSKIRGFSCYMAHIPPPDQLRLNNLPQNMNGGGSGRFVYSTRSRMNGYLSTKNILAGLGDDGGKRVGCSIATKALPPTTTTLREAGKDTSADIEGKERELLTDELRKILVSLNERGSSAVSPDGLFSIIWEVMPRFRGYQQQDAHEFLRYMLDRLHTELVFLVPWNGSRNGTHSLASKVNNHILTNGTDFHLSHLGIKGRKSIVTSVFGGTLQNEVICGSCKNHSKKNDPFLDLSLDIPCQNNDPRLQDCLSSFVDVEELSDTDMYFCNICKARQKSTKRFWICRLPNVLCLHLKRFRFSNFLRTKLDSFVHFPLTALDMTDYLLNGVQGSRGSSTNLYDLAAVIVHHGSGVGSGHYTAFAKKEDQWYHFNDSSVKPIEESMVAKCKAYILFYCRREFKNVKDL